MCNYFNHFLFSIFFTMLCNPYIYSEQTNADNAFYAVSSLCSHLDEITNSSSNNDLNNFFSEDDILTLWTHALDSKASEKVSAAMDKYYQASSKNSYHSNFFLTESKALLLDSWKSLNPYLNSKECVVKGNLENQRDFLLPENSSLQAPLRKIFLDSNVLSTPKTFKNAGFIMISERPSGMVVASHPKLPGHLIKAYIESRKTKPNWEWAVYRCLGVQYIRELIKEKNLNYFVVPNKWIYPLTPIENNEELINNTSPVILVVTDMQLVGRKLSKKTWRTEASKTLVQQLYCILSHGYSSCCLGSNIPFTKNKKFACIDTEVPQRTLPLHHVGNRLSDEMAEYWEYLVRTGGSGSAYR